MELYNRNKKQRKKEIKMMSLTKEEILVAFRKAESAVAEYESLQKEYDSLGVVFNQEHAKVNQVPSWLKLAFGFGGFYATLFVMSVPTLIFGANGMLSLVSIVVAVWGLKKLYEIVKNLYLNRPENKKRKEKMETMGNRGIAINKRADELVETIQEICPFLTEKYCYPVPIRTMTQYLQAGRANDLESMINLYELEVHRGRLEQAQNQLLREQQNQTAMLEELRNLNSSALDHMFRKR